MDRRAYSEVNYIINNMPKEMKNEIPTDVIINIQNKIFTIIKMKLQQQGIQKRIQVATIDTIQTYMHKKTAQAQIWQQQMIQIQR